MPLRQEALIRKQVEAYAADPSAGASKGQSSIQIRRDWKAKEKQLQVGLLSQLCSSAPASLQVWELCSCILTKTGEVCDSSMLVARQSCCCGPDECGMSGTTRTAQK